MEYSLSIDIDLSQFDHYDWYYDVLHDVKEEELELIVLNK